MTQLLRFITRTQLVRFQPFIHGLQHSLTTSIPRSQTVTLPQFSTKTSATRLRGRSPANDAQPGWVRHPVALPEELSRNVIHLSCESRAEGGVCDVYLVGTAHDTEESCRRVRAIVNFLKPEAVFLELCRSRVPVLPHEAKQKNVKVSPLELHPDSEFAVAYEEAIKYGGRVILGDRPLEITYERAWSQLPLWSKTKAVFSYWFPTVFLSSSDDLNEMEMDDSATAPIFCKEFPTLKEAFVHERDQYMSSKLLEVASESRSVVAVVGRGHLQGIKKIGSNLLCWRIS